MLDLYKQTLIMNIKHQNIKHQPEESQIHADYFFRVKSESCDFYLFIFFPPVKYIKYI